MDIAEKIKEARKNAGLTQKELSNKSGVAVVSIQQYERGIRQPRIERLQRIAKALNVPINQLIDLDTASEYTKIVVGTTNDLSASEVIDVGGSSLDITRTRINAAVDKMTTEGQGKVADYAEDILPRYRRQDGPQVAPAPREGTEGPQEGG